MTTRDQGHRPGVVGRLQIRQHYRLELAGIVRSCLNLARERRDEQTVGECRRTLAQLADDRFSIAVVASSAVARAR